MLTIPRTVRLPGQEDKYGIAGFIEAEWPFTPLGRSLDNLMREKGVTLIKKEFWDDPREGFLSLKRDYDYFKNCQQISYERELDTPTKIDENECAHGDFLPEETTFVDEVGYIATPILLERLADSKKGKERLGISSFPDSRDSDSHYSIEFNNVRAGDPLSLYVRMDKGVSEKFLNYTIELFSLKPNEAISPEARQYTKCTRDYTKDEIIDFIKRITSFNF